MLHILEMFLSLKKKSDASLTVIDLKSKLLQKKLQIFWKSKLK